MRTINECKAEIFRRGNEKKAKRAKRNKLLMSLVLPAFVCIAIAGSLPLLLLPPSDKDEAPSLGGTLDGGSNVGSVEDIPYTLAEVESKSTYGKIVLTKNDMKAAYFAIKSAMSKAQSSTTSPELYPDSEVEYTITFIGDGVKEEFVIKGSYLVCGSKTRVLSDTELAQLKQALKIE